MKELCTYHGKADCWQCGGRVFTTEEQLNAPVMPPSVSLPPGVYLNGTTDARTSVATLQAMEERIEKLERELAKLQRNYYGMSAWDEGVEE